MDIIKLTLVLLDVGSVQEYVFGSNKLRENVGGSTLVRDVIEVDTKNENPLPKIINKIFPKNKICLDKWNDDFKTLQMVENKEIEVETGYIGGGNALLLFRGYDNENAEEFIKRWTKLLLIKAPGLKTNVAWLETCDKHLGNGINECFKKLVKNKMRHAPQLILPRHGITGECRYTGLSSETDRKEGDKVEWISSVSKARFARFKAGDYFKDRFHKVLGDDYTFSSELDKLGQSSGESHIAVVHIDGNSIGQRFQDICKKKCGDEVLEMVRKLSYYLQKAAEASMESLLEDVIDNIVKDKDLLNDIGLTIQIEEDQWLLPIRPLVLAGDDITFICEGRLGIYCAEKFIDEFIKKFDEFKQPDMEEPLSACAGVAIIKTKYPFYRGYKLAEQLCKEAKKRARDKKEDNASWLDFHISYGGISGSLKNIRSRKYTTPDLPSDIKDDDKGNLCWRPWRLKRGADDSRNFDDGYDFKDLKQIVRELCHKDSKEKWPTSKFMELRSALTCGQSETKSFVEMMEKRKLKLPKLPPYTSVQHAGWQENKTPYFDAIELSRFYPLRLIEKQEKSDD